MFALHIKLRLAAFITVAAAFTAWGAQAAPSGETGCAAAAGDWAAQIICGDTLLSEKSQTLDRITDDLAALQSPGESNAVKLEQLQWRRSLNGCRTVSASDGITPADCVTNLFDMRIADMDSLLQEASGNSTPALETQAAGTAPLEKPALKPVAIIAEPLASQTPPRDNAFEEIPSVYGKKGSKVPNITTGLRKSLKTGDNEAPATGRKAPELIKFNDRASPHEDCFSTGNTDACLSEQMESTEVDLQMTASRMEMKLRSDGTSKAFSSKESRFADTRKDFRRYRENHCRWAASVGGEESSAHVYRDCFIRLTRQRTEEFKAVIDSAN